MLMHDIKSFFLFNVRRGVIRIFVLTFADISIENLSTPTNVTTNGHFSIRGHLCWLYNSFTYIEHCFPLLLADHGERPDQTLNELPPSKIFFVAWMKLMGFVIPRNNFV